jgi:hypothetical protein
MLGLKGKLSGISICSSESEGWREHGVTNGLGRSVGMHASLDRHIASGQEYEEEIGSRVIAGNCGVRNCCWPHRRRAIHTRVATQREHTPSLGTQKQNVMSSFLHVVSAALMQASQVSHEAKNPPRCKFDLRKNFLLGPLYYARQLTPNMPWCMLKIGGEKLWVHFFSLRL